MNISGSNAEFLVNPEVTMVTQPIDNNGENSETEQAFADLLALMSSEMPSNDINMEADTIADLGNIQPLAAELSLSSETTAIDDTLISPQLSSLTKAVLNDEPVLKSQGVTDTLNYSINEAETDDEYGVQASDASVVASLDTRALRESLSHNKSEISHQLPLSNGIQSRSESQLANEDYTLSQSGEQTSPVLNIDEDIGDSEQSFKLKELKAYKTDLMATDTTTLTTANATLTRQNASIIQQVYGQANENQFTSPVSTAQFENTYTLKVDNQFNHNFIKQMNFISMSNANQAQLKLDPAELGEIEVNIERKGDKKLINFTATPETKILLENRISMLQEVDQGELVSEFEFTFSEFNMDGDGRHQSESGVNHSGNDHSASDRNTTENSTSIAKRLTRGLLDRFA